MRHRLTRAFAALPLILAFGSIVRLEAADDIVPGKIIKEVVAKAEPSQTYALYLPSTFDAHRRWPILYAFDPLARGSLAVETFQEAAERYGYIVVGSNNSRNGPVEPSLRAGLAMLVDTDDRFPIDPARLYATGFSGGARVACAVAQSFTVPIAGVIGCAAGFPVEQGPSAKKPFPFCGTVGNQDYNWVEMGDLDRTLASLGIPHRTLRFEGRHTWPPKDVALAAIEFLELQAMASGKRPKDPDLIARLSEKELAQARAEEARGSLSEAYASYAAAARTFKGLRDVGELESKAADLETNKDVRDARKRERADTDSERKQMQEIVALVDGLASPDERPTNVGALYARIGSLKREEREARTPSRRLVSRRLLEHVSITAFYAGQPLIDAQRYADALVHLDVQAEVHPESAGIRYRIAVLHARAGNKKKALEALRAAAENGLADAGRIEAEAAFESLRGDAQFKQLVEEIRKRRAS